MKTVYIDFSDIGDYEDFYAHLKQNTVLSEFFGDDLEVLTDFIKGFSELPLHLEFVNLSVDQLETFEDLLLDLEDLEEQTDSFTFSYFLEQYEDEEWEWKADQAALKSIKI